MSERPPGCIWLTGDRVGVHYLFDVTAGKVRRKVDLPGMWGTTAGYGLRSGRRFVAAYVTPARDAVILQVGRRRFELDGETRVRHRTRLGGLLSELSISRPGEPELVLLRPTPLRVIVPLIDPTYDGIDESSDDPFIDVAHTASEDGRQWMLKFRDPESGPWHVLSKDE